LLNKSSDVVIIQKFLIEKGYLVGRADGRYGNMTRKAVMAFQRANGINPTGNVGPITMEAINTTILGGKVGVN
jgi:peptidoglycan hydrolase-like protein with peptidoglycan-binding domain